MPQNKTVETNHSVTDFINSISAESRRADCFELNSIISTQTGLPPKMWGSAIVGYGSYHYKYESSHEGDAPLVGFASRTNALVLYLAIDFDTKKDLLQKFGKHKVGKSCVYIKHLADVNIDVLRLMITDSVAYLKNKYPS
jgi:hypothetical protein